MQIDLNPEVSTLKLTTGDRALGRILTMDVKGEKLSPTEHDLGGDVFHSLFGGQAAKDPLPAEREINGRLMEWLQQSAHWPELAQEGRGNIAASLLGGELLHSQLLQDGPMREALRLQDEAARKQKWAEEAEEAATDAARANTPAPLGAAQLAAAQRKAARLGQAAEDAQTAANDYFSRLEQNNLSRAVAANMVKAAADQAEKVSACFAGWGHGPGSPLALDPKAALAFMEKHKGKVEQIARLAGRLRGIGFDARRQQVVSGTVPNGLELTKDADLILPSELARLSDHAPAVVRLLALAQYGPYGLLGRHTADVKNEAGPFVFGADVSGSMHGEREIAVKAVGLGLAQIAAADERAYHLFSFSSRHDNLVRCQSGEPWPAHVNWAEQTIHGGTDFDLAIREIIKLLRDMGEGGHNADGLIASDGEAVVSPEVAAEWNEFKKETGARLLYVQVAEGYGSLEKLADKVLNVPDLFLGADDVMRDAATWLQ